MSKASEISQLGFYTTPAHECSYLPDRSSVTMFADPNFPKDHRLYSTLSGYGFRRSGEHLYRPRCTGCSECIPVRLPVESFQPNRSQRRILRRNSDLEINMLDAGFNEEHFDLYCRYMSFRHKDGGMDNPTQSSYMDFLTSSWSQTSFIEIRKTNKLMAVAIVDHLDDALSAVYTFFEPDAAKRSLGTFGVLKEISTCAALDLKWLYLGYWVRGSEKMHYKGRFRPLQAYRNGRWVTLNNPAHDETLLDSPGGTPF